ncbi:MAG: hypothetical protein RR501_11150 [Cloacibacillus sp.]
MTHLFLVQYEAGTAASEFERLYSIMGLPFLSIKHVATHDAPAARRAKSDIKGQKHV